MSDSPSCVVFAAMRRRGQQRREKASPNGRKTAHFSLVSVQLELTTHRPWRVVLLQSIAFMTLQPESSLFGWDLTRVKPGVGE